MGRACLVEEREQLVELSFHWGERHHATGELLRDWVRKVPGRRWDKDRKVWVVDAGLLPPGTLTSAGFVVVGTDGRPAKRHVLVKQPPPKIKPPSVPSWFGLDLYRFQLQGASELLADGRGLLADEPGLGKTRTALAVAAALGAERSVVTCPASVLSHWEAEARDAFGAAPEGPGGSTPPVTPCPSGAGPSYNVVTIRPGRKLPEFPRKGIIICSDALLATRPSLVRSLCDWGPSLFVYDEAHRAKTWSSKRSMAARKISSSAARSVAISGTPVLSRPDELVPALDMTGHLGSVFGGRRAFLGRYCVVDRYGRFRPRLGAMGELKEKLDRFVWVRRRKGDVLSDLPAKSRQVKWLEIDIAPVAAAHRSVYDKIDQWLGDLEHLPDDDEIWEWCRGSLALVSDMRRAAGLAKVAPLTEVITDFVAGDSRPGGLWDRPLVVWAHHRDVVSALAGSVPGSEVIDGGTPVGERAAIVERFQAGRTPVLICSISAAGVGITLTKSADVIFAEVDWSPALVEQAEDRCARIGQTRPVQVTTCMAKRTLDETVAFVLARKRLFLEQLTGGGDGKAEDGEWHGSPAAWVLHRLVRDRLRALRP